MELYFDGASRGNPGLAGAGAVIIENKKIIAELTRFIGKQTNNFAEYTSILMGLEFIEEYLKENDVESLRIMGDSQLVIRQLKGLYRVKSNNLIKIYKKVKTKLDRLKKMGIKIELIHIKRNLNAKADRLANLAIDKR